MQNLITYSMAKNLERRLTVALELQVSDSVNQQQN